MEQETSLAPRYLGDWLRLHFWTWDREYRQLIESMRTSRLLVSDTYHCCVNAMAMGKPVVGIGREATRQTGTLGDYKKKILFDMFGLSDFYVEIGEEGFDAAAIARIRAAARLAQERAASEDLFAEVRRQTADLPHATGARARGLSGVSTALTMDPQKALQEAARRGEGCVIFVCGSPWS